MDLSPGRDCQTLAERTPCLTARPCVNFKPTGYWGKPIGFQQILKNQPGRFVQNKNVGVLPGLKKDGRWPIKLLIFDFDGTLIDSKVDIGDPG